MYLSRTGSSIYGQIRPQDFSDDTESWTLELAKLGFETERISGNVRAPYSDERVFSLLRLAKEFPKNIELSTDLTALQIAADPFAGLEVPELLDPKDFGYEGRTAFMHQKLGAGILLNKPRQLLAWEQGVGKSKTIKDAVDMMIHSGEVDYCLIVCDDGPMISKWATHHINPDSPYKALPLKGTQQERKVALMYGLHTKASKIRYFIINYSGLRTVIDTLRQVVNERWVIVLDEIHQARNMDTQRWQILFDLINDCEPGRVYGLSGTPVGNNVEDLFAVFALIDQDVFGDPSNIEIFKSNYVGSSYGGQQGFKNMPRLMEKLNPYMHRILKEQVLDLPPKIYDIANLELPPELRKVYNTFVDAATRGMIVVDGKKIAEVSSIPLVMLQKVKQVLNNWINVPGADFNEEDMAKLMGPDGDMAPELVSVLLNPIVVTGADGKPIENPKVEFLKQELLGHQSSSIIWTFFKQERAMLERMLSREKIKFGVADSSVSQNKQLEYVDAFQAKKIQVIVAHPRSLSTGVDLFAAKYVYYFTPLVSVLQRKQSEDRAHRQGVEHAVNYYDLLYDNTIEANLYIKLQQKIDVATEIMNKRMTFDDLL